MKITTSITIIAALALSTFAHAGPEAFHAGKVIPEFGKIAHVNTDQPVYRYSKFKVAFDVSARTDAGTINRKIESAVRFINMHDAAGVKVKNIKLTIVLHGGAVRDVTGEKYYAQSLKEGEDTSENVNVALIEALIAKGVKFYVCGQSAAYYDVKNEDLLPGVEMALSAMTAHALLQQKGYTLNPF